MCWQHIRMSCMGAMSLLRTCIRLSVMDDIQNVLLDQIPLLSELFCSLVCTSKTGRTFPSSGTGNPELGLVVALSLRATRDADTRKLACFS